MSDTAVGPAKAGDDASRRASHWNDAYDTKGAEGVSWFQQVARPSLDLIIARAPDPAAAIIDVGGGSSHLVDALLGAGYSDLSVLDVSARALADARERLAGRPDRQAGVDRVQWIEADLLAWQPGRTYALWHDRAVFHFLSEAADRARYVDLVSAAVAADGHLVMGTFAEDGPESCSGLPVVRYGAEALAAQFSGSFDLIESQQAAHVTPWGAVQQFTWVVLAHRPA